MSRRYCIYIASTPHIQQFRNQHASHSWCCNVCVGLSTFCLCYCNSKNIYPYRREEGTPPPVVINSGAFCPMEKSGSCKENDTRAPVGSIENYCGVFVCAYCTLRLLSTSTVCCVHCTVYIKHSLHPTKSSPFC